MQAATYAVITSDRMGDGHSSSRRSQYSDDDDDDEPVWKTATTPEGKPYWYHSKTNNVRWSKPPE